MKSPPPRYWPRESRPIIHAVSDVGGHVARQDWVLIQETGARLNIAHPHADVDLVGSDAKKLRARSPVLQTPGFWSQTCACVATMKDHS